MLGKITAVLRRLPYNFPPLPPSFDVPTFRPLPRCFVTEQFYRQITEVFRYRTDLPRGLSLRNFAVNMPPFSGANPTFIDESRFLTTLPPNCCRFSLPTRPLPRCLVAEQVYGRFSAVFHYRPDHLTEVSRDRTNLPPKNCYIPLPRTV